MGNDLKNAWKETGKGLGSAFKNLGKTLIKTGAVAAKKADEWANKEDYPEKDKKNGSCENKQENTFGAEEGQSKDN